MNNIVNKTLEIAHRDKKPVIIVYMGKKEMTQRRVYIRSIIDEKVTAYCTQKKGVRIFDIQRILSAKIADD
ncbi:MAG: hypothetical protein RSA86_03375 [Christensenellaceae bacterium]